MQVGFIYSPNLIQELDKNVKIRDRSQLVFSLINSYNLFHNENLKLINPMKSDDKNLKLFHSQEYIDYLKSCQDEDHENEEDFGIGFDCPFLENLYDYATTIAGSSLTAALLINQGLFNYVINWFGGWHHAKRDKASGFCYINDIVLCIMKLRQKFNRILYIDLDQHHGDGVQEAFEYTNKVLTLSIHKYMSGFFPGTGSLEDIGKGLGKFYSVNVPLKAGIDDRMFSQIFTTVYNRTIEVYQPEVMVVQCGADSLIGDPIDSLNPFNLTLEGYSNCVRQILSTKIPTIFLGGGGYNFANSAKLWCKLTSVIVGQELNNDIPEHEYFLKYAPDYELNIGSGKNKNENTMEYIDKVVSTINNNLSNIKIY
ncbi:unnamed protein product [Brachionus calyciflorus]|uniref:Histone deacetylase 8 n=1 Tax=Brachionus calyciflorus TaxID=104777 RepID=A0A814APL5_9BILA|nr:unnamed protein product [Brachionus calyciflorus]